MAALANGLARSLMASILTVACSLSVVVVDRVFDAGFIGYASAQESKKERETRKTPALRNNIYEKLAEAQVFAEAKQYVEAQEVLDDMLDATSKKSKLNGYELANVYNTYAYLRYVVEDYEGALNYYQKVIDQRPDIPVDLALLIDGKNNGAIRTSFRCTSAWLNDIDARLLHKRRGHNKENKHDEHDIEHRC